MTHAKGESVTRFDGEKEKVKRRKEKKDWVELKGLSN